MDVPAIADQIEELGGLEFRDPDHVHETLTDLHRIIEASQTALARIGTTLPETGVHPAYAEAVQEAAGSLSGIADDLRNVVGGGVMRGPGG